MSSRTADVIPKQQNHIQPTLLALGHFSVPTKQKFTIKKEGRKYSVLLLKAEIRLPVRSKKQKQAVELHESVLYTASNLNCVVGFVLVVSHVLDMWSDNTLQTWNTAVQQQL